GPGPGPRLRADPHAAAPAVGVDGEPRRPAPTRGDVPRVVGPRARRCVVSARDEVLARIRAANAAAGHPAPPEVPRDYRRAGAHPAGAPELLDLFRDRLVDYKATVLDAAPDGVAKAVRTALGDATGRVVVPPGLPEDWWPDGIAAPRVTDDGLSPAELDTAAAVVTGCASACATTGTIALDGSPDQGRRAITLVPDVHVCVVRAEQVVETVPEML